MSALKRWSKIMQVDCVVIFVTTLSNMVSIRVAAVLETQFGTVICGIKLSERSI